MEKDDLLLEVGKTYTLKGEIRDGKGFRFSKKLEKASSFIAHLYDNDAVVFKVEILGEEIIPIKSVLKRGEKIDEFNFEDIEDNNKERIVTNKFKVL